MLSAAEPSAATAPSLARIQHLVDALGDADYFVRQKAEAELTKIGFDAVDALTAATDRDDMEIATRANRLLYVIRSDWSILDAPAAVANLLTDYDSQDDGNRESRIMRLIDLPDDQGISALCKVIRYERSLVLAKTAAVRLLDAKTGEAG